MLVRMMVGVGLLALGYYLGREVGRAEPLREELRRAREAAGSDGDSAAAPGTRGPDPDGPAS